MKWEPAWKRFARQHSGRWLRYWAYLPRRCGKMVGPPDHKSQDYCDMWFWLEYGYRYRVTYYCNWQYLCAECAVRRALTGAAQTTESKG